MKKHTSSMLATALLLAGLLGVFVSQRILSEGSLPDFALYGGALLALLGFGLRAHAWSVATGDVRGVEGRLLLAYAGVAIGLGLYGLSTDAGLRALPLSPETAERAGTVLAVLWASAMLVSLMAILFMELVYLRMPIAESVELRRVRTSLHAGLSLGLSIVFLLSVNYIATARDVRTDVSFFRTSMPSAGTQGMVKKLDKKLRVILFFAPGSDVLPQVKPYFQALAAAGKHLELTVKDVALSPELSSKHKIRDNGSVLLLQGEGANEKGESFQVGTELTQARATLRKLDGTFQQSFAKLVRPSRTLYLTVGHGERNAKVSEVKPEDGTAIMTQVLGRLNLKSDNLGLTQGLGSTVPSAGSAVAVVGPSERFLPEEAAALLAYVRKGGKLFLMLDPDKDVGLAPLLSGIGVELLPGIAMSETYHMKRAHNDSDRALVFSNSYTSHPTVTNATRHQREVATVLVQGAALKASAPAGDPKPRVTFPLRSAAGFWRDQNADFKRDDNEPSETLNLIAAVTIKGEGDAEGRVVLIGDGDFVTDKVAGNAGNMLVFVDSLAWLIGNEDLSAEVSSEEDRPIEHTHEQDKIWFYATTFGMPAPILFLGLWVARRRRVRAERKS